MNQFNKDCNIYQRGKAVRQTLFRTLRYNSIPENPWADIFVEFVTGLPWSKQFDAVCVVVNWLTKMRNLINWCSTIDIPEFTRLFILEIFKLHKLPDQMISDSGL